MGLSNLQFGNVLAHVPACIGMIPPDWVLLNTCSTDNVIGNMNLMDTVRLCTDDESLKIFTNGGSLLLNKIGPLKHFPMNGYYNPKSIANVLSLKTVGNLEGYYLKMNTKDRPGIYVENGNNKLLFQHSHNGLFHCTIDELERFCESTTDVVITNVNLLSSKVEKYTKDEIKRAKQARELQECFMWPSDTVMKDILKKGNIINSDIDASDIDRALDLFGVAKEIASGKMTVPSMKSNQSTQIMLHDIAPPINHRLKMYFDILYVSGQPYLHTKTKYINYITISKLPSRKIRD